LRNAGFLTTKELIGVGFAEMGENVLIHETVVLVGTEKMRLGSHVRIDPFCVITAGEDVLIGSHVHIAAHVLVSGGAGITLHDFAGISHGAKLLSASDDFAAGVLTGPTVPANLRKVWAARIEVGRHSVIGANAVVLPGTQLRDGAMLGALSLARGELEAWKVHAGVPARIVAARDKEGVLRAETRLRQRSTSKREEGP
jgi:acetyltransferase-like isoleucine patch superfamily enzyme